MELSLVIFAVLCLFHVASLVMSIRNSSNISPMKKDIEHLAASYQEKHRHLESMVRSVGTDVKEQHAVLGRISENTVLMGKSVDSTVHSSRDVASNMQKISQEQREIAKAMDAINSNTLETRMILTSIKERGTSICE